MDVSEVDPLAELFQQSPSVITAVLSHFSFLDLLKLKRVCRSWNFYAGKIIGCRRQLKTLAVCKPLKSSKSQTIADLDEVQLTLKGLGAPIQIGIVFGRLALCSPSAATDGHDLKGLKDLLPPASKVFGFLSSAGIIGTFQDGTVREIQNPRRDCLSSFFFSALDGEAEAIPFSLSRQQCYSLVQQPSMTLENFLPLPPDKPTRSVLLVSCDGCSDDVVRELGRKFWMKENGWIACSGGVAESILEVGPYLHFKSVDERELVGLIFAGSNVRASSLILHPYRKSRKSVVEKMMKLKTFYDSLPSAPKQEFAFFFTCCGRGKRLYGKENVETSIFGELFPRIPVSGLFSMGEYGWDFCPSTQQSTQNCPPDTIAYSYTTAISLVVIL